jgi:hypothetical protein
MNWDQIESRWEDLTSSAKENLGQPHGRRY